MAYWRSHCQHTPTGNFCDEYSSGAGTQTHEDAWTNTTYAHAASTPAKVLWSANGVGGGSINPAASGGYADTAGQVRAVFRYVRNQISDGNGGTMDDPADPIPQFLTLKTSGTVSATAKDGVGPNRNYQWGTEPYQHQAAYGIPQYYEHDDSKEHVSVAVNGKSAGVVVGPDNKTAQLSVKDLIKVETNGESDVTGPWFSVEANASVDGTRYDTQMPNYAPTYQNAVTGTAQTSVTYSAAYDDRAVTLSRPNAHDEWVDSNGNTHGDTIYSYSITPLISANSNKQTIQAHLTGTNWTLTQQKNPLTGVYFGSSFPHIDYQWSISGPVTSNDNVDYTPSTSNHFWATLNGQSAYPDGQDPAREQKVICLDQNAPVLNVGISPPRWELVQTSNPQDVIFNYKVTDKGDSAVAERKYILSVHDEIEWTTTPAPSSVTATRRYSYVLDSNGQILNIIGTAQDDSVQSKEASTSNDQGYDIGVSGGVSINRIFKFLEPFLNKNKAPQVTDPNTHQDHDPDNAIEFSASYNHSWGTGINNVYPLGYDLVVGEKAYAVMVRTYQWKLHPFRLFDEGGEIKPDSAWYVSHSGTAGPGTGVTEDGKYWSADYQERTDDAPNVMWLKVNFDFFPNSTDPVNWVDAEASFFSA